MKEVGISALIFILLLILYNLIIYIKFICKKFDEKYSQLVVENSERLKSLLILNKQTKFNKINKKIYSYHQKCNSKRQLDKLDLRQFFICVIENEFNSFSEIYKQCDLTLQNQKLFLQYIEEYNKIKTQITEDECKVLKTNIKKFTKRENKLFVEKQLNPTLEIYFEVKATYTSPAGQSFYDKDIYYNTSEFMDIYKETKKLMEQKQTRQYQIKLERMKVSDSLRYDVLKRDGFKCQICGSAVSDGVKLHVDHILPVSKGGKTTMDNLRTLCDRCNIGKRDKIE